jgi:hypothetical protein
MKEKGLKSWSFLMVLEQEASTCGALLMVKIPGHVDV